MHSSATARVVCKCLSIITVLTLEEAVASIGAGDSAVDFIEFQVDEHVYRLFVSDCLLINSKYFYSVKPMAKVVRLGSIWPQATRFA